MGCIQDMCGITGVMGDFNQYGRCGIDTSHPPCWVENYVVDYPLFCDGMPCDSGTYGEVHRVQIFHNKKDSDDPIEVDDIDVATIDPRTYALKIGLIELDDFNPHITREVEFTKFMYQMVKRGYRYDLANIGLYNASDDSILPPTIHVHAANSMIVESNDHKWYKYAMLMDFHPYNQLHKLFAKPPLAEEYGNRDGMVFKLLYDASYVLSKVWESGMIDRDVKLSNFVMSGDLRDWRKVTFIKVDYGTAISKKHAQWELARSVAWRREGFCHWGSHVKF